jgi:2-keto-4-pentenoate hydratase
VLHDGAAKIEPEIAFMMGRDLPPREQPYEEADLREAIGKTHTVLELIGSRFSDPKAVPFPENLADCIQNQALFVGAAVPNALEKKLEAFPIGSRRRKALCSSATHHPNGHPQRR